MGSVIHDHEHVHETGTGDTAGTAAMTVVRLILTIAGAAAMIVGAFLTWVKGHDGVDLAFRAYYRPVFTNSPFLMSAGAVMILLGLIALVGLADRGGWLSRIAGALGIVAFVLILISMSRAVGMNLPDDIGEGLVWSVAGSIVVLIGGSCPSPGSRGAGCRLAPTGYPEVS
ncbi:MAG TPA: hypothetical protein VK977_05710 [Actinomycetota bacterium]|nr:hypothetical protein [Actinomycetota bacterium]